MNAKHLATREDFQKCLEFHGHLCPGLSIGYRAALAGMERLGRERSEDEEIVAIVETDACSADAVQVLTGCTFGKGNFFHRDYGKMVLTLACRQSGRGVRVSVKPGAFAPDEEHSTLLQKVMSGNADEEERRRFEELHHKRSRDVLELPEETLFSITSVALDLPAKARIDRSLPCDMCGEPAMASKMTESDGRKICRGCMAGSS